VAQDPTAAVLDKLDTIIGFLAIQGPKEDQVNQRLVDLGISDRAIAKVLGLTESTWAKRKSRMKLGSSKDKSPKTAALASSPLAAEDGT
jgi:transposase